MEYRIICHSATGRRKNSKYVARVAVDGYGKSKYRYFYSKEEYQAYLDGLKTEETTTDEPKDGKGILDKLFGSVKNAVDDAKDKAADKIEKKLSKIPEKIDKAVDKVKKVANDFYEDEDNVYFTNARTYDKKIEKIKQTDEWKAIVKRKDPEYVKKNSDGTTSYLIDDYMAKKKMPVLDVVDDIINNRPVTVNKIEKDAIVAGLKQTAASTINLGILAVGAATKFMLEKTKLGQGSYQDEVEDAKKKVEAGAKMVDSALETASTINEEDVKRTAQAVASSKKVAEATKVAQQIDEDKVIAAARILAASDSGTSTKTAEVSLANLSDEEIALLSALLKSMNA